MHGYIGIRVEWKLVRFLKNVFGAERMKTKKGNRWRIH